MVLVYNHKPCVPASLGEARPDSAKVELRCGLRLWPIRWRSPLQSYLLFPNPKDARLYASAALQSDGNRFLCRSEKDMSLRQILSARTSANVCDARCGCNNCVYLDSRTLHQNDLEWHQNGQRGILEPPGGTALNIHSPWSAMLRLGSETTLKQLLWFANTFNKKIKHN